MPIKDAEGDVFNLGPKEMHLCCLHECFGDTLSYLYIQEFGFVPTFFSNSSSTKCNGDLSCFFYLADKYTNISFPEGNSLWPWIM